MRMISQIEKQTNKNNKKTPTKQAFGYMVVNSKLSAKRCETACLWGPPYLVTSLVELFNSVKIMHI